MSDRAFARLYEIGKETGESRSLRVAVRGGGCSGFQYEILFDDLSEDDLVIERNGNAVLIDSVSLAFLENATIDYVEELIGSRFVVLNPNATSTCGCAMSFSV